MRITIQSTEVAERNFVSKTTGKPLVFREQEAWAHLSGAFPEKILIDLYDRPSFPPGEYDLLPTSHRVSKYRKLEFGRIFLQPAK